MKTLRPDHAITDGGDRTPMSYRFVCHQVAEMTGDDLYRLVQWLGKRDYMITQEDLFKKARDKALTMEEISLISHYMDINETGGE